VLIISLPRNAAWLLLEQEEKLDSMEQQYVAHSYASPLEIAATEKLAQRFVRLIRQREVKEFGNWLEEAAASSSRDLNSFAARLRRNECWLCLARRGVQLSRIRATSNHQM
jgi:transposase